MYSNYNELLFRESVDRAVEQVKTILGTAKNPRLASDEDHTYGDKYELAEFVTNLSIAAQIHVLNRLGLDPHKLQTLLKWVIDDKKTVTLSFRAEDGCSFIHETLVDPAASSELQTESKETNQAVGGGETPTTTKTGGARFVRMMRLWRRKATRAVGARVVRKIRLSHWKVDVNYSISAYPGHETDSAVELQARSASTVIVTSAGLASDLPRVKPPSPIPDFTVHNPIEVNITWLLESLNRESGLCQFSIDRELPSCKTPRRNEQVDAALKFGDSFRSWCIRVVAFYDGRIEKELFSKHNPLRQPAASENSLANGTDGEGICCLIVPVMENGSVLTLADKDALLDEHSKSIDFTCGALEPMFPSSMLAKLATISEATIVLLCNHGRHLVEQYCSSINYIEDMLRKQLIQAIGMEVTAKDFDKFMRFHNQKLFGPLFAPKPFTHAIRRPEHYPDGILSIESDIDASNNCIETMVRHIPGKDNPSFFIPINAATSVEITGDRFLHGWIQYKFAEAPSHYKLVARARQFSSFLLVVGTMTGRDQFSPKHAIILQNKDEVIIPLLTEVIPTAKEFKNAIASLSTEQQDFAKAYRLMQLESSVFGVCVIQLKPQLEKLLGLPAGALAKEIQLTQDLMSLFVDYQIPSDVLSFGGDARTNMTTKLLVVKGHVKAVMDMIDGAKEKQLMECEYKVEDETQYWDDQLTEVVTEIQGLVDCIPSMKYVMDKVDAIERCEKKLRAAKLIKHSYKRETRAIVVDEAERRKYKFRLAYFDQTLKTLTADLEAIKAETQCGELCAGGRGADGEGDKISSLSNTKSLISRSKEVAICTLEELERQRAVIECLDREVDRVHDELALASFGDSNNTQFVAKKGGTDRGGSAGDNVFEMVPAPAPTPASTPVLAPAAPSFGGTALASSPTNKREPVKDAAVVEVTDFEMADDFTLIPKALDSKVERLDTDGSLKSTIIKTGEPWTCLRQENLLTKLEKHRLSSDRTKKEKNSAFDMLDAISRSGMLPIECAELHVIVAVSHCFENDVMAAVIQDNINPIEKAERSSLIVATTIHDKDCALLLQGKSNINRLGTQFPCLFVEEDK